MSSRSDPESKAPESVEEHLWVQCLAAAGERVGASLEVQTTVDAVAQGLVPAWADWSAVHVNQLGKVVEVALHFGAGHGAPQEPSRLQYARKLLSTRAYERVVTTGSAARFSNSGDGTPLAADAPAWALCVPLQTASETIGALSLGRASDQAPYAGADLDRAMTYARRSSAAIQNARTFQRAAARAETIDAYAAATAHSLQTPLTAMLLTLHLLQRTGERLKDSDLDTRVAALTRQAEDLSQLIKRLLDAPSPGSV